MNPASRVLALHDKAMQRHDNPDGRMVCMWSDVVDVPKLNGELDEEAITAALLTLRDEIDT